MAYNLAGILSIKDKNFTSTIKKSATQVSGLDNKMKHASNQMKKYEKAITGGASSVVKRVVGIGAAYLGIRETLSFGQDLMANANEGIAADTKMANMMKNVKGTTDAQVKSMQDYAASLQKVGVVGDDAGKVGMAQLATFNLQTDSIKTLTKGMYDLAVNQYGVNVSGEQMQGIANVIGKAMDGNAGALTRYGVTMSDAEKKQIKYGNQAQKSAVIAKVLAANVGGINEAMAKTPEGAQVKATNNWGDMKEELGAKLLPKMTEFYGWFETKMPTIQTILETGIDKGIALFEGLGTAIDWVRQNSEWLIPVVGGVAAAVGALSVINTARTAMDAWKKSTLAVTIAEKGLSAVMMAPPMGIALAIGLIVTAGILLIQNWDTVKQKALELWEKLENIGRKIKEFFGFGGSTNVKVSATSGIDMANIPMFASGINRVPKDMLSVVHKDEAITPAQYNPFNPNAKSAKGKGRDININIIGYNKSVSEIINELIPPLKLALENM